MGGQGGAVSASAHVLVGCHLLLRLCLQVAWVDGDCMGGDTQWEGCSPRSCLTGCPAPLPTQTAGRHGWGGAGTELLGGSGEIGGGRVLGGRGAEGVVQGGRPLRDRVTQGGQKLQSPQGRQVL